MLLFHCPGVAKLPANAEHKLTKCCVSLSCPITMLLSYLLAQFPVGHWLEYLKSELSTLLSFINYSNGNPAKRVDKLWEIAPKTLVNNKCQA